MPARSRNSDAAPLDPTETHDEVVTTIRDLVDQPAFRVAEVPGR